MSRRIFSLITFGSLFMGAIVFAGTFFPTPSSPDSSFYTLSDIYNKISSSTYEYSSHLFPPTTTPAETFVTLTQIWDSINWPSLNNSGILDAGFYATSSLTDAESNLLAANIATGTSIFGVVGVCNTRPPEEIATVNLATFFPNIGTGICAQSTRSTTVGPYDFDVILKAKTAISADDYLAINGTILPVTGVGTYCGDNRPSFTSIAINTEIMTITAGTTIEIVNGDTIGVATAATGIISIWRVY